MLLPLYKAPLQMVPSPSRPQRRRLSRGLSAISVRPRLFSPTVATYIGLENANYNISSATTTASLNTKHGVVGYNLPSTAGFLLTSCTIRQMPPSSLQQPPS